MLVAATYFRPCGARLGNVFLLLSKLGAFTTAALNLAAILQDDEALSDASESVTAAFTAIATAQTVLDVACQLLALASSACADDGSADAGAQLLVVPLSSGVNSTVNAASGGLVGFGDVPPPAGADGGGCELRGPAASSLPQRESCAGTLLEEQPPPVNGDTNGDPLLASIRNLLEQARRHRKLLLEARRMVDQTNDEYARHGRFLSKTPEQAKPALETLIKCAASSRELNILQDVPDHELV
jgi:hypothetical protein